ncbi:MAG: lipid II flippase MurJ [bacterium]
MSLVDPNRARASESAPLRIASSPYASAAGITLLLGAAKLLGFVEKQFLAFRFGASASVDAFLIAFGLMMVIFDLARAVIGPALLPLLTRAVSTHGEPAAQRAAGRLALVVAVVFAAVAAALMIAASPLVRHVLAPRLDPSAQALVIELARILLPALVPLGAALVTYTLFHTAGRFFAPACGELAFKMAGTAALLAMCVAPTAGLEWLAVGYLGGGAAMLAIHLVALGPARRQLLARRTTPAALGREAWSAAWPMGLAAVAIGLRQVLESAFATRFGGGSVAVVAYAWKLVDLPTVLAAEPLAVVFFALFARLGTSADPSQARVALAGALRSALWVSAPLAVALAALAGPMVELLFRWGSFDARASESATRILSLYAPAVPFVFADLLLTRFAIARGRLRPAVRVELLASALNILAWPILGARLGIACLPVAFTAARAIKLAGLLLVLRAELRAGDRRGAVAFGARVAAALVLGWLALAGVAAALRDGDTEADLVERGLALALPGLAFLGCYAAASAALGIGEVRTLVAHLRRRFATATVTAAVIALGATLAAPARAASPGADHDATDASGTLVLDDLEWNRDAVAALPSALAFQRERDGNLDVYLLDPRKPALRRLTVEPGADRNPVFAPDGKSLYFVSDRSGVDGIYRVDLAGGGVTPVVVGDGRAEDPAPTPDGRSLIFTRSPRVVGWNLVIRDLATGAERALTDATIARHAHASVSGDGTWLACSSHTGGGWQIARIEIATGRSRTLTHDPGACRPDVSPTDGRVAFVTQRWDGKGDIAVSDSQGGGVRRLSTTDAYDYFPAWSRDGRWIAFATTRAKDKGPGHRGPWHLMLAASDGSGVRWLTRSAGSEWEPSFAPAPATPEATRE